MENPPSSAAKIDRTQDPIGKAKLPWPQLRLTGSVFQEAADEMEMVLGKSDGAGDTFAMSTSFVRGGWARTTREFIDANRLTGPRRPGLVNHVSADRACRLLFDWVEKTKIRRRDAEQQRVTAYFDALGQSLPAGETADPPREQTSLNQLHCKDILILLTCIFGFQDAAEVRRLTHTAPHLVLLASLLHRLFYAHADSFHFESFRAEASELLADMGQYFGVEFERR